jgi:hypothetical protein
VSTAVHSITPEELYWAILTHEQVGAAARPGTPPHRDVPVLDELFAEFIPIPFETVKAAYITIDNQRVLAVAATRDRLASVTTPETVAARPAGLPASLADEKAVAPLATHLNFLTGDLEPRPVTAAKRRAATTAAAAIVLLAAVALIGIERRTSALHTAAAEHRSLTHAALQTLYPKAPSTDNALATLDQDLGRLTRTRAGRSTTQADAADAVESLLNAWPRNTRAADAPKLRTESLTATPESLTLTVALDDRAGATPLSDSLRTIAGWRLFQPTFTAVPPSSNPSASTSSAGTLSLRLNAETTASTAPKAGGDR